MLERGAARELELADILKDEGFETRTVGNSEDCMAAITSDPPSLLILDIWLKDSKMDGIDILKTVKRDNPDVPVVIISGHGNIEIAVAAIKQGDLARATELSFDCIQCGLCAMRCPAEIVQYNVGQLGRRMFGRHGSPEPEHLKKRLEELESGDFNDALEALVGASTDRLKELYAARGRESDE